MTTRPTVRRYIVLRGLAGAAVLLAAAQLFAPALAGETASERPPAPPQIEQGDVRGTFAAIVDGQPISFGEFEAAMRTAARERFYHGSVSPQKMAELQADVARDLVLSRLMMAEAAERGIAPDMADIEERLQELDEQNRGNERWEQVRTGALETLRARMVRNATVALLEEQVRQVPDPTEEELRSFYEANPDLFTEPTRERVGVILLKVNPGAPTQAWQAAREEAERLRVKLAEGADFAELATLHSGDASADNGGDMGYLHRGMLSKPAQEAVDALAEGDISDPVELLQGYALFRLQERTPPVKHPLADLRERAVDLYRSRLADARWEAFKAGLLERGRVTLNPILIADAATTKDGQAPAKATE